MKKKPNAIVLSSCSDLGQYANRVVDALMKVNNSVDNYAIYRLYRYFHYWNPGIKNFVDLGPNSFYGGISKEMTLDLQRETDFLFEALNLPDDVPVYIEMDYFN